MKNKKIIELLATIPNNCTQITIQGVNLQIIDSETENRLLTADTHDLNYHHCILSNGTFLFTSENNKLLTLYKVI